MASQQTNSGFSIADLLKHPEQSNAIILQVSLPDLRSLVDYAVAEGRDAINSKSNAINVAETEGYKTRAETADFYRISLQTLNERTKSGQLRAYRIGHRILYKVSELSNALVSTDRYTVPGKKRGPKPKGTVTA